MHEMSDDETIRGKGQRQRAIAELIRSRLIGSQDELAGQLARLGYKAAQATVSRDLEELGAVKVRGSGGVGYAMPGATRSRPLQRSRLAAIFGEWVLSIETAANLLVIKTQPGSAHLVAAAIDQAELAAVVGTVSGDDTLFVATRGARQGAALAGELKELVAAPA